MYDGSAIREARKAAGITQAELAELVGVGKPHVSKIEQGKERPSQALLDSFVPVLGLDLIDMLIHYDYVAPAVVEELDRLRNVTQRVDDERSGDQR